MPRRLSDLKPGLQREIVEFAKGHGVKVAAEKYDVSPQAISGSIGGRKWSTLRRQERLAERYAPGTTVPCPRCGGPTEERACKVKCLKCRSLVSDCGDGMLP